MEEEISKLKEEEKMKMNYVAARQTYFINNPENKKTCAGMLKTTRAKTNPPSGNNQATKRPCTEQEELMETRKKGRSEGEEKDQEETNHMEQIHREAAEVRRQLREESGSTGNRERKNEQDELMETDEEKVLESELREIYDMFPEQKGINTPKRTDTPVIINTSTRQQETGTNVTICMAKILTSVVNDNKFNSSIEKYKIARV